MSSLATDLQTLQELQTSDPDKYEEIMSGIAGKLQAAATTASESGDTNQANMLNELAGKFQTASEDGTMPDLAPPESTGSTSSASSDLSALFGQNTFSDPLSTLSSILDDVLAS